MGFFFQTKQTTSTNHINSVNQTTDNKTINPISDSLSTRPALPTFLRNVFSVCDYTSLFSCNTMFHRGVLMIYIVVILVLVYT
jgi:hypothetical protein